MISRKLPPRPAHLALADGTVFRGYGFGGEGVGVGGRDESFVQGQRAARLVVDRKVILTGRIAATQVALAAYLSLLVKLRQGGVDDEIDVASQGHMLQARTVASLALNTLLCPLAVGGIKASGVASSAVL